MFDQPINLVLELLRAIRADIADVRGTLSEHGERLSRIELGLAAVRRDQASDAERVAHVEVRLDQLRERLLRVERRLDLAPA